MNIIEYYWTGIYVHNDDIYPYLLNVLAVIAVLNNYATKGLDIYILLTYSLGKNIN